MRSPLLELSQKGQSVWLDDLTRSMIIDGGLQRLIQEDGLSGVTSNPTIFHHAMTEEAAYDEPIATLARRGLDAGAIYENLAIEDVRGAADLLRPVFEVTKHTDGFVSLEVSPHLAHDTRGTIDEAERLWREVGRANVYIKIPGTGAGIPAIEACLIRGINVNITLLFSLDAHRRVIQAYWSALEKRRERGEPLDTVSSVASYFLSRIDVKVDRALDRMVEAAEGGDEPRTLRGHAAIASAKLAYRMWKRMHESDRWRALEKAGARVQKPLWASTSTKDPAYRDIKYVEALVGPQTVNTMPSRTLDAFRSHGRVALTLERNVDEAEQAVTRLGALGIDLGAVAAELVEEGVEKFVKPFDALMEALDRKRAGRIGRAPAGSRG